tara:strand:+ start:2175 stop:2285 length:111 start_codon:yes stop_codon:yes gene_type:complete
MRDWKKEDAEVMISAISIVASIWAGAILGYILGMYL